MFWSAGVVIFMVIAFVSRLAKKRLGIRKWNRNIIRR